MNGNNEAQVNAILRAVSSGVICIDERGCILTINPATQRLFGYSEAELIGQNVKLLMPSPYLENHDGYLAMGEQRIIGSVREVVGRRKDGSTFPLDLSVAEALVGDQRLFVATILNVSERKRGEEMRASLAAIVESSEDAIIGKELDGTIVSWNRGAERLYGYSTSEVIGKPVSILSPADHRDELPGIIEQIKRGERVEHYETVRMRKDGSLVDVSLTISPVRNEAGQIVGAAKIARDITRGKQAEAQLRKSKEELEQLVNELRAKEEQVISTTQQLWQTAKLASVGELAASIAHELNNPLTTVRLRIESLLAHTPADEPKRRNLEIVAQEAQRMGDLVANLLSFSRRGEEKISTVDIRDELTKAVDLIEHHLRKRQVAVVRELAEETPSIYSDRQKLRQVFLNLLTNASDAMLQGGTLTLRSAPATMHDGRPGVRIEFVDTGVGIPVEHLPRIFDPFYTTKDDGRGTGLGLAICRRAVEEHHGTIEVFSEVGRGTTVRILLPVKNGTNVALLGKSSGAS
jgi:PAS domain S-box-containing protein